MTRTQKISGSILILIGLAMLAVLIQEMQGGQAKAAYQMNNEDREHMLRLVYQKQIVDQNYRTTIAPMEKELGELLKKNCTLAGFAYGVNCVVDSGTGQVTKKAEEKKK